MPETPEAFARAARSIALPWIDRIAREGWPPDEASNLLIAALSEVVAQQLGPVRAVERLRDAADVLEAQFLNQSARPNGR
ncbi:MAG: hypothetical protein NXH71_00595 [Erythrobacteraceae bacterium]|nr:hypothetical protein [Erythrobacteraceae bacterium]